MKKLMVMYAMVFTGVCLAQVTNDTISKKVSGGPKINSMTWGGEARLSPETVAKAKVLLPLAGFSHEARTNVLSRLAKQYNSVINEVDSAYGSARHEWKAGGEKGYIEIDLDTHWVRYYSPDGRLVSAESTAEFVRLCDVEAKSLREKYLKELGMTEDEVKSMLVKYLKELGMAEDEAKKAAQETDWDNPPIGGLLRRPRRLGGLARLRRHRMEMEAKQREETERKREADAAVKAEREAREQEAEKRLAEERAQQRKALLRIQEQLREQREEREAARRADGERKEEAKR